MGRIGPFVVALLALHVATGCDKTKPSSKAESHKDHKEGDGHDHKEGDGHDHKEGDDRKK